MDLRRQIAIIRAWFPLLVVSVVLAAGAAFVVSSLLPKVYEAKATLIVGQSLSAVNPDYNQLLVSQRLSTTYAAVATTRPILETVIKQLGLGVTSDELLKRVRADAPLDSTLLTIAAQDADPARAAAIANALAEQLIAASPAIQGRQAEFQASIDADLKATQDQIDGDPGAGRDAQRAARPDGGAGRGPGDARGQAGQPPFDLRHAPLVLLQQRVQPAHRRRAGRGAPPRRSRRDRC